MKISITSNRKRKKRTVANTPVGVLFKALDGNIYIRGQTTGSCWDITRNCSRDFSGSIQFVQLYENAEITAEEAYE